MKRIPMLIFLLGTMTAMAQEDFNELHFNPQGPKVKQVIVNTNNSIQDIYLFDSTGRNYAQGWRGCDTLPFCIKPIDTVLHYFHRIIPGTPERLAIDSLFLDIYIIERDSILKDCTLQYWIKHSNPTCEERQIHNATCLVQTSIINRNNDTIRRNRYSRGGELSKSYCYQYDNNHHITKAIEYDYSAGVFLETIAFKTFDKKGNCIRADYIFPDGTKSFSVVYKRDKHGNIIWCKEVIYRDHKWVTKWRFKYQYDKHGNWTSRYCHNQTKRYTLSDTREITYWE